MAPFDPIHAAAQLKLTRRIQRHKVWAGQNSSSLQALSGLPPLESENGKATADPPKRQTSPSWDLFPLSIAIPEKPVPVSIPTLASIPSPFADFGNRTEQLLHIVDKRASSGVRKLFKKIRKVSRAESGRVDLRQTMLIGSLPRTAPLTSSRENGSIVYLAQKPSYTAEHSQRKKSTARGEVRQNWVEENHLIKLDAAEPTHWRPPARQSAVVARLTSPLDIRKLHGISPSGKAVTGFFILCDSHSSLRINGIKFEPTTLVGPLPDFAVIEVGKAALFWWHTDASLDYVPSESTQAVGVGKRSLDAGEEYTNLSDVLPPKRQKIGEGIIAGAYVERPALSAREPDNQPALCPDIQPSGFVANPGRPPPLETVHQPQTTPIVVYPAEENVQLPKGPGSGSKTPITSPGTGLAAANTLTGGKSSILTGGKATIPAGGKVTVPIGGKATLPTKGKTPITTSGPQGMVSVTWQRRLIGGLTTSKAEREKLEKHTYHQINKTGRLLDDDVVFAIAAVWQRLWTHKTRFAFCHADVFRWCRKPDSTDHGLRSVGAPHPLIMPLLFNPDDDPIPPQMMGKKIGAVRSEDGHFLLVIAERKSANANEVTLRIMDSAPGSMSSNVYRAAAQNIVRYSGWMGVDRAGKPLAVKPQFTEEIVNVPLQSDDVSCGVHVIFNAWAYMLGIPITPNAVRGNRSLYKEGRDLINLALTGCLNIQTIQAFLNSYRYSQPQSQQSLVAHLKTVGTNQAVVNAFLEPIQESELAAALA